MSPVFPVVASHARYRAALAELPRSTWHAETANGAVVVIPGEGAWWEELLEAQAAGASAVVVSHPQSIPAAAQAGLVGIPVVVERPHLRADAAAEAVRRRQETPATVVTVECAAPSGDLDPVLRDGVRWAEVLAGGPLHAVSGAIPAEGGMALLEAGPLTVADPVPVTVLAAVLGTKARTPLLRVTALAKVRTVVEWDGLGSGLSIRTGTEGGSMRAPNHYEGSARLALRRAMEAASKGAVLPDLGELLADQLVVAGLRQEHKQG
ncbi:hypothetical protein ACIQTZ_04885 [Paenarthrobacter sp. NPDC090520]|uniref:hypothetical protein n=1 Tax=Paenarthrobacter sp. NPDC090520 TaxID=3364382 RepID=UPI003802FFCE